MITVLAGAVLLSTAIAGGYGLYRYFTASNAVSMSETRDEFESKADDRPAIAPKPKPTSHKAPLVDLGSDIAPFPMTFSKELRAKLKLKSESKVEESCPVKALTFKNETERGSSFDEVSNEIDHCIEKQTHMYTPHSLPRLLL